jgi:hypothetical protein
MSLICEEYVRRNNFSNPYIRHVRTGSFYFGSTMKIWKFSFDKYGTPPNFLVQLLDFSHNKCDSKIISSFCFNSFEFEEFIFGLAKSHSFEKILRSRRAVFIAAWEMFLVCYDKLLAREMDPEILFETIDPMSTLTRRYKNFILATNYLKEHHSELFSRWQNLDHHARTYLYWINDLILNHESKNSG